METAVFRIFTEWDMSGKAAKAVVTEKQLALLEEFVAARSTPSGLQVRCSIILLARQGHN